ncbi:hypothetical protein G4B88_000379 [Cannabis sativa]|uniref:DUF4283 domain-containing protein n=1 Tax=Cannabis sativa TaxID=3483 RepID=A0A7J6F658_CANSA|nr:hypothetical protein G4B88_000379 [Cannabis sativa]
MPWPSWLALSEVIFDKSPFWVRLSGIPPFYWNKTNLEELASKVSPNYKLPRYIDFERGSFGMGIVRFRATIDIDKPLFSGFYMKREAIKDLWIQYKYEKLPKLCLKCGVISHDQKFCFKPPTVTKDSTGAFFPLFGNWMKHEEPARRPFSTDLPKWFQEWIIQKRLTARESRRQLPGKRRLVEQLVEELPATEEERVCRFPMVTLPRIGEVCPFDDTANLVVPKVPALPPHLDSSVAVNDSDISSPTQTSSDSTLVSSTAPDFSKEGQTPTEASSMTPAICLSSSDCIGGNSERGKINFKDRMGSYSALLGSQAQPIQWPSNDLWNLGFKTLTGLGTVDKFMTEPSLFNPILGIEDFRSLESDFGPKKRKALEGVFIDPNNINKPALGPMISPNTQSPSPSLNETQALSPSQSNDPKVDPTTSRAVSSYSPGSSDTIIQRRKRGRPALKDSGKSILDSANLSPQSGIKRRGRPRKSEGILDPKTQSLKRKSSIASRKRHASIVSCWDKNTFDLKVDLNNHFVIVDCSSKPSSSCVIEEVKEQNDDEGLKPSQITGREAKNFYVKDSFRNFFYVPPVGTAGGLVMCWMKGVDCKIESADKFRITACISSDPPSKPWIFMGIYGPPVYADKEAFWTDVGDYVSNCHLRVVLMGDLSGTLKDSDCLNYSRTCNIARYSFDLRRAVQSSGLIDPCFLGTKFTWFKKGSSSTGGSSLKRARLDRALANVEWRLARPNAIVSHLTASSSDHSPILLDTCGGRHCTKPQFKYELMWDRDPRIFWVVKNAWMLHPHENPMVNMYHKLKATKDHLRKWNFSHFRKLSTQISEAPCKMDQPATTAASVLTPPSGWLNCCSDVNIDSNHSFGAAVFRDSMNRICSVVTDRFPVTDPALAEASMLLSAAKHATQSNYSSVNFFCDNVCAVSNILKAHGTHHNINLEGVSTHFQMLTAQFANWSVQKINRKENFMAHNDAKWAKINSAIGNIQVSSMDPKVFEDYKEWWPDPG